MSQTLEKMRKVSEKKATFKMIVWRNYKENGAESAYMNPAPGPPIEGYEDQNFSREVPENSENLIEAYWRRRKLKKNILKF